MAEAVAKGPREVGGCQTEVRRVPETTCRMIVFAKARGEANQPVPNAQPTGLANYDALVFGVHTRSGNMTRQMRKFFDQTSGLESTIPTLIPTLLHHGMIVIGLPYAEQHKMGLDEIKGGSIYGASTIAGGAVIFAQFGVPAPGGASCETLNFRVA